MKRTEKELWAFVHRANTKEKILAAEHWMRKHFDGDNDLFDDLMMYLAFTNREMDK